MESLFLDSVVMEMENYNSTFLTVYQQMNTMVIFISDYYNNRIQIISENFEYKPDFGKEILHYPRDVKLYKDNIFILDVSNPCLHIFNKDLVLQRVLLLEEKDNKLSILITSVLTSLVLFLSQIITLILFSFPI